MYQPKVTIMALCQIIPQKNPVKDDIPKDCSISEVQILNQSETGGLATLSELKIILRVKFKTNIYISVRSTEGQIGTVKHIKAKEKEVSIRYLVLDDTFAGHTRINDNGIIAKNNR